MQGSTCTRLSETSIMFVGFSSFQLCSTDVLVKQHLRKRNFSVKMFYCDGSTAVSGITRRAGENP